MYFDHALQKLRNNYLIRRKCWPKNNYLTLLHRAKWGLQTETEIRSFCGKRFNQESSLRYQFDQTDILANDWEVYERS